MKQLSELLLEFEKKIIATQSPILDKLQKGLEYSNARELLMYSNIVSNELSTLYNWRNGIYDKFMNSLIEEIELFPEGIMFSLQDALSRYELYTETNHIWDKKLFPIFTNGGGDYLLLDIKDAGEGMILLYAPSLLLSEEPETIYDSLANLFETIVVCIEKGAYRYNLNSTIEVDYNLKYEISAKNNPKSKYWDDYR